MESSPWPPFLWASSPTSSLNHRTTPISPNYSTISPVQKSPHPSSLTHLYCDIPQINRSRPYQFITSFSIIIDPLPSLTLTYSYHLPRLLAFSPLSPIIANNTPQFGFGFVELYISLLCRYKDTELINSQAKGRETQ